MSAEPPARSPNDFTSPDELLAYRGDRTIRIEVPGMISGAPDARDNVAFQPAGFRLAIGPDMRAGPLPRISCLMPTRRPYEQVRFAIDCFRRQTWPNRELVILDQGANDRLAHAVATLNDPAIRYFPAYGEHQPLGAVRNRTMDLAAGELICAWDDDDLQHPARLEIAMAALEAAKAGAIFLARILMWIPARQRLAVMAASPWPIEGTILTIRDPAFRYPPLPRGEDTPAIIELLHRRRGVLLDLPELYVYVIHGRNTWDSAHVESLWARSIERTEGAATEARLARLSAVYPLREYAALLAGE